MTINMFLVDAFATEKVFSGNPAAICPLDSWLPDELMQNIAMENNQSETAFFVGDGNNFRIRWFTPVAEVDLCGHATLASAHVLFNYLGYTATEVQFHSKSGVLGVTKDGDLLTLDFPVDTLDEIPVTDEMALAFDVRPIEALQGKTDWMLVFQNESQIRNMKPDFGIIKKWPVRGLIATAPGSDCDFVSRFFAPKIGIFEDPVTGSAHTTLVPYWAPTLKKLTLSAIQLSPRTGSLTCKLDGKRVKISGKARTYLVGKAELG